VKDELRKGKVPKYMSETLNSELQMHDDNGKPVHWNQKAPDEFMKHMDSSFEAFFYQRDYTERNFTFYL
jgi:hypothetical protein